MLEIGPTLREARHRAALELSQVESATMIPARYLDALERERFEALPGGLYRRSFLREYALFLGLDGDVYATEYDLRFAPVEEEPLEPLAAELAGAPLGLPHPLAVATPRRIAAVAAVAAFGIAVWLLDGLGGTVVRPPVTPHVAAHAAPNVTHSPRPFATGHAPTTPLRHAGSTIAARRAPPALDLTAARGDCWVLVQVGSSSGPVVYQSTLHLGETVRFGLHRRLWIRLGAPWNLQAAIGHRSVTSTLPSATGDVVASTRGLKQTAPVAPTPSTFAISDGNASQLNTRGYELMLGGNYIAALPLLRRAVAGLTDPTNPVDGYANFNLGQTLVRLDHCGAAIRYLRRATQLEPASREAQDALDQAQACTG